MQTKHWLPIILFILASQAWGQLAPGTFWIQFTDKNNTNYSLTQPEAYLSERSIERRNRYNIDIDSTDIPINPWYLDSLTNKGAEILNVSKWLNGAAIYLDDFTILGSIHNLDFVDGSVSSSDAFTMHFKPTNDNLKRNIAAFDNDSYDYGLAQEQIELHNGQELHNHNYLGQGMQIAVIDAGFNGLNNVAAFDSLFLNNQIIGTWDFVSNDTNVYDDHFHGKAVLSTIAANLPGQMLGAAPKAEFLLLRSENAYSEYKIEEINWIAAAEYADSIGVNIITTSLGYQNYSSPSNQYQWSDLDGQTAPITRATDMAAQKGILMMTSAGNEGTSSWGKITPPADANYALTVGACKVDGDYAYLSSRGNTVDGRIKPDITSVGQGTTVITSTDPTYGNGTSYSTPLMAGLMACLWQIDINKTNFEMMDLIKRHSHQYNNPDSLMGYGIPNFATAYEELTTDIIAIEKGETGLVKLYPTLFTESVNIKYFSVHRSEVNISISGLDGKIHQQTSFVADSNLIESFTIENLNNLPSGVYLLNIYSDHYNTVKKIIRQ